MKPKHYFFALNFLICFACSIGCVKKKNINIALFTDMRSSFRELPKKLVNAEVGHIDIFLVGDSDKVQETVLQNIFSDSYMINWSDMKVEKKKYPTEIIWPQKQYLSIEYLNNHYKFCFNDKKTHGKYKNHTYEADYILWNVSKKSSFRLDTSSIYNEKILLISEQSTFNKIINLINDTQKARI